MTKKKHKIFVYGTLKKGFYNNKYLAKSKFIAPARTTHKYALCIGGPYKGPYIFETIRGKTYRISGEIYKISTKTLKKLDKVEGVSTGRNTRHKISVSRKKCRAEMCWAWIKRKSKTRRCRRYKAYTRKLYKKFLRKKYSSRKI